MSSPEPPPYTITPAIVSLVAEIAGEVGRIGALSGEGQIPKLRRENRIRSVHASRAIENSTLTQVHPSIRGWKRPDGQPLADAHPQPMESAFRLPPRGIRHP